MIKDKELTEKVRMETGKFYLFYKPSFINGYEQYIEKDIDFNFLQAFEGVCRDEFVMNGKYIESEEFKTLIEATQGIQTEKFA